MTNQTRALCRLTAAASLASASIAFCLLVPAHRLNQAERLTASLAVLCGTLIAPVALTIGAAQDLNR